MLKKSGQYKPHGVVIGSGFGGLAAAVRLAAKGYAVSVFEKLDGPGGRAYTYRQNGHVFDAGPTIITAPFLFTELWELAGRRFEDDIDLRPIDPFYKIRFDDGDVFTCSQDPEKMRAEVARISPTDLAGYERFMVKCAEIYKAAFEDLASQPFHQLGSMLAAVPALLRLEGYRSVYSLVKRYFKSEKLRIAFSFHSLLVGGNPFATSAYFCLISHLERAHGVHYAMGGTGALVRGLVSLVEGLGGTFVYNAEVVRILTTKDRASGIELASGEKIAADLVVSNADAAWTYSRLLADHPRRRWTDRKIESRAFSMGLFVWYFGTNKRFESVYQHEIVLGPRYKPLLDDIFHRKVLAEDASLYLHRPSANDPALAPEGCESFYVLSPVPNLTADINWEEQAEPYRQRIQARLEETSMPGLGASITTSRILTPLDFRDRLSSIHGAGFAFEPTLFQSAWFRPHNRSSELPGLFLVGAGTHPGAGVPGVLSSAKVIDQLIPAVG